MLFLFLLLPLVVNAWWDQAHLMIADIARAELSSAEYAHILNLLSGYKPLAPSKMYTDYHGAAVFLDVLIKPPFNVQEYFNWHFLDTPYNPLNLTNITIPYSPGDVVWALQNAFKTLTTNTSGAGITLGFAMHQMIHLMGDIMTPFHNILGFWPQAPPTGDSGAFGFPVQLDKPLNNLHFVWDSGCNRYTNNYPFTPAIQAAVDVNVSRIVQAYPKSSFAGRFNASSFDPVAWSQESYNIAVASCYPGVTWNGTVSGAYMAKCAVIADQQIALAGYRLAATLHMLLPLAPQVAPEPSEPASALPWQVAFAVTFVVALIAILYRPLANRLCHKTAAEHYAPLKP